MATYINCGSPEPVIPYRHMNKRGFTLLELLVVIAIIGLVGTMAAVAVNAARTKQRDATRLSQVRQVQAALEEYFNQTNLYPAGEGLPLGDTATARCLGTAGFAGNCSGEKATYLRTITSTIETGLDGLSACGTPARNAFCYSQTKDGSAYAIQFELENAYTPVGLAEGLNCALPEGMKSGKCE